MAKAVPTDSAQQRVGYLDGVRGWASLAVLLGHITVCFLALSTPFLKFDKARLLSSLTGFNLPDLAFMIFMRAMSDGHLAVFIFFVLSGYALSTGHLNTGGKKLMQASAARYFRLMIPIFFTTLFAWDLLASGLMFNQQVATSPETSADWLGTFYRFDASLIAALRFALYDVFFRYDGASTYNPTLWTMAVELGGSFMIYAYLGIFRTTEKVYWRFVLIATGILFVFRPMLACFMMGYIIAELSLTSSRDSLCGRLRIKRPEMFFMAVFAGSAALSACIKILIQSATFKVAFLQASIPAFDYLGCILASAMVFSVSCSTTLKSFFTNRLSAFLGRISFPLYLIQIPVICSWSSWLYLKLPEAGFDRLASNMLNLFSTIALCIMLAALLVPLEKFSIARSKQLGALMIHSARSPKKAD